MLENDIAWEAWDGYLKFDINREIPDDLGSDDWTDEEWEFFKQRYYTLTYEQNYGPECEDAVSAYFPFHDEVMELLVDEIRTLGFEHDPRRPNPNQLTLENTETDSAETATGRSGGNVRFDWVHVATKSIWCDVAPEMWQTFACTARALA